MTIVVDFPKEHRPHVEVFTISDRGDGRRFHVVELVGRAASGPFSLDVAHRYSASELLADVVSWWREGVEVVDTGLFL